MGTPAVWPTRPGELGSQVDLDLVGRLDRKEERAVRQGGRLRPHAEERLLVDLVGLVRLDVEHLPVLGDHGLVLGGWRSPETGRYPLVRGSDGDGSPRDRRATSTGGQTPMVPRRVVGAK